VLCVDDDASFVTLLEIRLESHGFEVVTANHGLDPLKEIRGHADEFDAILRAYDMPEMNGVELVRSLRKQEFRGPIVVMFGNLKPSDVEAFSAQGIATFVKKPFNLSRLIALFSNA
jgi:CheY-like chemotaxis protein